ncbi:MAG: glycosyltransferase family 9 protein [Candidatus Coatesbacteria bacterium]|nr:MAG: glycosyltransferase family 9 protein [Candidatus Coatesbacteria bacterium]
MKVVTFKRRARMGRTKIAPGEPVLLPDGAVAKLLYTSADFVEVTSIDGHYTKYEGQSLTNRSLLLVRNGGFGDLLFLTPLLRYLDERYKHAGLAVGCGRRYHCVYLRNPYVRRIFTYPIKLKDFVSYDYQLCYEGTLETSTDADFHAVDLMAAHAGVADVGDRRLAYDVEPALARKAKNIQRNELKVKPGDATVGLHLRASSPIRTYPLESSLLVAAALGAAGARVFLLGAEGDWEKTVGRRFSPAVEFENVDNLCGRFRTMDHTAAFLSRLDLLVGPDSSLVHFAGALDVPTIALYGPFPGAVRTKYYPQCITLEGRRATNPDEEECAPCFKHGPYSCPKAGEDGASPCLRNLDPEMVIKFALLSLARGGASREDPG